MNVTEAEKLLCGYATGTLTPAERESLLAASLHHQDLFNALADEEALRELLADPAARRRLAASLAPAPVVLRFWRPLALAGAAGFAAVAIAVVLMQRPDPPLEVAQVKAPPQAVAPAAAPETPTAPPVAEQRARSVVTRDARVLLDTKEKKEMDQPVPASPVVVGALERKDAGKAVLAESLSAPTMPKEKRQAAADEVAKMREEVAAPFHWELQRPDGSPAPSPMALRTGDAVRLFLEARQAGQLVVSLQTGSASQEIFTRSVQPGDRILVPATGGLPSGAGERELVVSLVSPAQLSIRANSALRSQTQQTVAPVRVRLRFVD